MEIKKVTKPDAPVNPSKYVGGLTKFEFFVAAALQGLCASPNAGKYSARAIAKEAVKTAEETIDAINAAVTE